MADEAAAVVEELKLTSSTSESLVRGKDCLTA